MTTREEKEQEFIRRARERHLYVWLRKEQRRSRYKFPHKPQVKFGTAPCCYLCGKEH